MQNIGVMRSIAVKQGAFEAGQLERDLAVRSSLSVDWVGLATLKRSPGVAVLRLACDLASAERPGAQDVPRSEAGRLYGTTEIVHTSGATTARLVTSRNKRSAACGVAVGCRVNEQLGRECADNGAKID